MVPLSVRADDTWTGAGGNANWSNASNWSNGAPNTAPYGTLFFSTSSNSPSLDDIANLSENKLLMNTTGAFTINGTGTISLFDNGGTQAKIENNSGSTSGLFTLNTATINFAATSGAAWGEINAVSGDILFGTNNTLNINGSIVAGIRMFGSNHTTTFNNTVSASGKYFATTGANTTVAIGGAMTTGDFYLMNGGTLKLNTGGSLTTSGFVGAALRLGGDFGTTGSQNLASGATFQLTPLTGGLTTNALINTVANNTSGALLIDSLNTSGTNTLAGDFYLDSALRVNQASGGTIVISDATTDIKGQTLTLTGTGGIVNLTGVVGNSTGSGQVVVGVNGTAGGPTVNMSQANTYSGDTFVRAGTLAFATGGSAANSTIRLGSTFGTGVDASINLTNAAGGQTITSVINPVATTGTGLLTLNSLNTSGTNTYSGHIGMDRDFTITQAGGGVLNISSVHTSADTSFVLGTDIKGNTLTLTSTSSTIIGANTGLTVNGTIYNSTGSGSVLVNGGGIVLLSNATTVANGANSYTGGTTLTGGGTLIAQNTLASTNNLLSLGTGTVTLNSGTLSLKATPNGNGQNIITGNGITGNNVLVTGNSTMSFDKTGATTGNNYQFNNLSIGAFTLNTGGNGTSTGQFLGTTTLTATPLLTLTRLTAAG
ncbi:MAG: hypothetical protein H0X40_00665 [Chthoniobacterales bacterium]|nr:hypothetical protein [Chthoniobacterales bacterium]